MINTDKEATMHPALSRALNEQHILDMQRAAQRPARRPRPTGRPLRPARQATGWFLVRIGLRLAVG